MKKPNIIYFLSDQHNVSMSGFMGNKEILTPNLDKLAQEGVVLDNCYCNSPLCVPSRSSMLSGRLPCNSGILNNMQMYPSDQVTMAHSLSNAGYETVLCGRMHFSGYDQWHGFEKRIASDMTNSFPGKENEDARYAYLKGTSGQSRIGIEKSGGGSSCVLKYDEDVVKHAVDFMDNREDDRPLFMIVGTYGPHCPYVAYDEWYDYYYKKLDDYDKIMDTFKPSEHEAMKNWRKIRNVDDVTFEEIRRIRAAYAALITINDIHVGEVLKSVEKNFDMENTIFIYTSDHGDNAGEHGLFWKTNFYEGSARVPAVVYSPSNFKQGIRLKGLSSLLDIAPTIIDLAEAEHLPEEDGMSIVQNLVTGEELPDRHIISVLGDIKGDNPSAMIRYGDYKLIIHAGHDVPQVYNLKDDPYENNDLAQAVEYQDVIETLKNDLLKYWQPDKAMNDLKIAKAHYKILAKWINVVGWEALFEYESTPEMSYINS